jgi:hypothetical protein
MNVKTGDKQKLGCKKIRKNDLEKCVKVPFGRLHASQK